MTMSWGRLSTRPLAPEDDWFVEPDVGPSAGHEEPRERRTSDPEPREGAHPGPQNLGERKGSEVNGAGSSLRLPSPGRSSSSAVPWSAPWLRVRSAVATRRPRQR